MTIQCVITGCALISHTHWIAGDLFDAGNVYIFHGNYNHKEKEPTWLEMPSRYIKILEPKEWFERRGVFVIEKTKANLNDKALAYIRGE